MINISGFTIGAHYENALAAIDQPGSEFYVPYPTNEMSCDAVEANIQLLNTFIGVWNQRLRDAEHELIRSRETIDNCQTIIKILTTKLGQYQVKQDVCNNPVVATPPAVTDGDIENPEPGAGSGSSNNSLLWIALIGIGGYAFIRSRRNRTRQRAGTKK